MLSQLNAFSLPIYKSRHAFTHVNYIQYEILLNTYQSYVQPIIYTAWLYYSNRFALFTIYNICTVWLLLVQLETEEPLLIPHAKAALDKYHHQVNALAVTSSYTGIRIIILT